MSAPAHGFEIIRERIESLPGRLRETRKCELPSLPADVAERGVVATGAGSSEAAARYFVHLLHRAGVPAEFRPQSAFYGPLAAVGSPYLALFSQGLSPNAEMILARRKHFHGALLVTSSTVAGQLAAGRPQRAEMLQRLIDEGAMQFHHPMENEYDVLPRFVGPVCSLLTGCRMVESLAPGALWNAAGLDRIPEIFEKTDLPDEPDSWVHDLAAGPGFHFTHDTSEYAQNLAYKIVECLFHRPPTLGDALSYAHGMFQLDCASPHPNWLFTTHDPDETDLVARLSPMFERAGTLRIIRSPLPLPLAIFHYEAFLNTLILHALKTRGLNLVDWPGKGLDGEGYGIREPGPQSI